MPRKTVAYKHKGVYEQPPGSGHWIIDFKDEDGHRVRERIDGDESDALAVLEKRHTEVREQRYFPKRKKVVLADAIRAYLQGDGAGKNDWKAMRHYGQLWTAELGDEHIDKIKPAQLELIRNRWLQTYAKNTVKNRLSFLRRVLNIAIRDGHLVANPVSKICLPKDDSVGKIRFMSYEEQMRLKGVFPKRWWHVVLFAIRTGLRQGEQFMLRWEQVNLEANILTIPRSKHGEERHVPFSPKTRALLLKLLERNGGRRTGWVFLSSSGQQRLNGTNFYRRVYVPALEAAGLIPARPKPKPLKRGEKKKLKEKRPPYDPHKPRKRQEVNWHTLRHTTASRLVMKGVPLPTVKEIMGHKTLAITMRYAHLAPSHIHASITALD